MYCISDQKLNLEVCFNVSIQHRPGLYLGYLGGVASIACFILINYFQISEWDVPQLGKPGAVRPLGDGRSVWARCPNISIFQTVPTGRSTLSPAGNNETQPVSSMSRTEPTSSQQLKQFAFSGNIHYLISFPVPGGFTLFSANSKQYCLKITILLLCG